MALKDEFAKQLEQQIAVWQAQIRDHQERMKQAGADAQANYEKSITMLQANSEEANRLLREVQGANENAWRDMQMAQQRAFEQIQRGWADALGRFI